MRNYRRYYIPSSAVFITCVTHHRIPYFANAENIELLLVTIQDVQKIHPFTNIAYVILPDHFHWIIQPTGENHNFSSIMQSVKWNFTRNYKKANGIIASEIIWQRGFWDHIIRNDKDFSTHLDYIHWNPVKHDLVLKAEDYKHSSLAKFMDDGYYPEKKSEMFKMDLISKMNFE